jgi:membrane protease YdiL (CAAX protease family)
VNARRCFLQSLGVLTAFSVARWIGVVGPALLSVSVLTGVLVIIAWRARATLADLGLGRRNVSSGLRWGFGASGVVLLVLVAAVLLPATNGLLHDSRGDISGGRLLYELVVSILVLTTIPEEFAFRGVLLGSALRLWGTGRALLVTSALFGLWHIEPTLHMMAHNRTVGRASDSVIGEVLFVLGAVAVTFVAGLLFSWLRLRSRSLIAPLVAHIATNGIALTTAWFAVH